jgi:hypothetical protein
MMSADWTMGGLPDQQAPGFRACHGFGPEPKAHG